MRGSAIYFESVTTVRKSRWNTAGLPVERKQTQHGMILGLAIIVCALLQPPGSKPTQLGKQLIATLPPKVGNTISGWAFLAPDRFRHNSKYPHEKDRDACQLKVLAYVSYDDEWCCKISIAAGQHCLPMFTEDK